MSGFRLVGKDLEIRTGPQTSIRLHRLPVQPERGKCQIHSRELADINSKDPRHKLHINYLELKTVFLAPKEFQDLWGNSIVLIATDDTTVVAYINKERGMKLCPLCALLWRILTWCSRKQVTGKAQHIPGRLNVVADKLSRVGQTIQTGWFLLPEVFQAICNRWHQPQIDLFATRFNNKLTKFVSPVPDPLAWAVDAPSLSWEGLDPYAFPPVAIWEKWWRSYRTTHTGESIMIAPDWANMP